MTAPLSLTGTISWPALLTETFTTLSLSSTSTSPEAAASQWILQAADIDDFTESHLATMNCKRKQQLVQKLVDFIGACNQAKDSCNQLLQSSYSNALSRSFTKRLSREQEKLTLLIQKTQNVQLSLLRVQAADREQILLNKLINNEPKLLNALYLANESIISTDLLFSLIRQAISNEQLENAAKKPEIRSTKTLFLLSFCYHWVENNRETLGFKKGYPILQAIVASTASNDYNLEVHNKSKALQTAIDASKPTPCAIQSSQETAKPHDLSTHLQCTSYDEYSLAKQLAAELLQEQLTLYCQLTDDDFMVQKWPETPALITKYTASFNNLCGNVCDSILTQTSFELRVRAARVFVKAAACALEQNDFSTAAAICAGLNHGALLRLRETWKAVDEKGDYEKARLELLQLFSGTKNYASLRQKIDGCLQKEQLFVPWIVLVLKDLASQEETNPSVISSEDGPQFNYDKLLKIEALVQLCLEPQRRWIYARTSSPDTFSAKDLLRAPPPLDEEQRYARSEALESSLMRRLTHTRKSFSMVNLFTPRERKSQDSPPNDRDQIQ